MNVYDDGRDDGGSSRCRCGREEGASGRVRRGRIGGGWRAVAETFWDSRNDGSRRGYGPFDGDSKRASLCLGSWIILPWNRCTTTFGFGFVWSGGHGVYLNSVRVREVKCVPIWMEERTKLGSGKL